MLYEVITHQRLNYQVKPETSPHPEDPALGLTEQPPGIAGGQRRGEGAQDPDHAHTGAGAIGMVALFWLYPKLASAKLVGTDIAHAVPLTAVAGLGHLYLGSVDFVLLGYLLVGSLPGIYLGSHLSRRFPEEVLRPALASIV